MSDALGYAIFAAPFIIATGVTFAAVRARRSSVNPPREPTS